VLSYPSVDTASHGDTLQLATPVLRVRPGHGDARTEIRVAGQRAAPDAPIVLVPPAPLTWIGEGSPDAGAGYVFSRLEVDRDGAVGEATIKLEIDHTFSGDLQVALVTPSGEHLPVTRGASDANDIRGSFEVTLPPERPPRAPGTSRSPITRASTSAPSTRGRSAWSRPRPAPRRSWRAPPTCRASSPTRRTGAARAAIF
jgi:hypothetical protein